MGWVIWRESPTWCLAWVSLAPGPPDVTEEEQLKKKHNTAVRHERGIEMFWHYLILSIGTYSWFYTVINLYCWDGDYKHKTMPMRTNRTQIPKMRGLLVSEWNYSQKTYVRYNEKTFGWTNGWKTHIVLPGKPFFVICIIALMCCQFEFDASMHVIKMRAGPVVNVVPFCAAFLKCFEDRKLLKSWNWNPVSSFRGCISYFTMFSTEDGPEIQAGQLAMCALLL